MDSKRFDRVASTLTAQHTRRGVIRFLGAAVLASAGLAPLGGNVVEAKRRTRRKQGGGNRCSHGKIIDRVQVPADGSAVETKSLAKGEKYRLRVSGYLEDDEWGIDGEYYFLRDDPNSISDVYDRCFDGTPVGVEVSGAAFSGWGEYIAEHVYERKITGKGEPLSLHLSDCYYDGNTGSLKVEVFCD